MHINGKKMAMSGILLALTEILIILSGILEFNTLFLLGAASFSIGIIIREYGVKIGAVYYAAAVLLSLILAPNKLYCITFAALGIYLLLAELIYQMLMRRRFDSYPGKIFWACKYVVFNLIYLPVLFLFPKMLFVKTPDEKITIAAVIFGQIILFVYDKAYGYFQTEMWNKMRKHFFQD